MQEKRTPLDEKGLIAAAVAGDRASFDRLVAPHLGTVRGFVHRMVGHPDDAADLVQESLLRAFTGLGQFREGALFSTWLCSIAAHACIDHLRREKRWRPYAQSYAEQECAGVPEMRQEILNLVADPGFSFDTREHIAACFTCVARSLPPMEEAAIVLREIFDYSNQEAADVLGVTEPVLRNHLAAARGSMQASYEGLCALVNKQGICHQCAGFRNATAEGRKGPAVEPLAGDGPEERFRVRLRIVRDTPFEGGVSRRLHDLLFDRLRKLEGRDGIAVAEGP
jgi:RNA polymerase sigma-70 factor, ECF subfamily